MHTARFSDSGGSPYRDTPGQRPPEGTWDQGQRPPLEGTWDQTARQEVTSYRDPPPCGQTDTCENITLPQTLFAGGNNGITPDMGLQLNFE